MGVILKENNLIHTKMRHEKFLGSSRYRFDKGTNTIYLKEKLRPLISFTGNEPIEEKDFSDEIKEYLKSDSLMAAFDREPIEEKPKKPKKKEYKLNKKKVREKCSAFFGLKQSRKFLAFYTISFPMGFPDDNAFTCLNTLYTRLREKCGLKSYLWVAERQKNGTIHFHILTNTYMYVRTVNHFMAKAIETQVDALEKKGISINYDVTKYNGVDVRHVNNNRKALNSYLTKYVSKNSIALNRLPYHSSRDISELFTAETFTSIYDSDFSAIREALKHITTFVVDNEYCTIEYLCQKQENGKFFNPPNEWYWLRDFCNEQIYNNHYSKVKFKRLPLA